DRPSCINCGRVRCTNIRSSKARFRLVSNKNHGWLHALLKTRGIQLQSEMIICGRCRNLLYREHKHHRYVLDQSTIDSNSLEDASESEEQQQQPKEQEERQSQQTSSAINSGVVLSGVLGNGDDYLYLGMYRDRDLGLSQSRSVSLCITNNRFDFHYATNAAANHLAINILKSILM
ncbi:unnamed protein product, partial [Adineta ricciae]